MSKKVNYYYVLVFVESGPAYVTEVDHAKKIVQFDKLKEPLKFNMTSAEDVAFGLGCNGYNVVTVKMPFKLCGQPYNYEHFDCKFIEKEKDSGKSIT